MAGPPAASTALAIGDVVIGREVSGANYIRQQLCFSRQIPGFHSIANMPRAPNPKTPEARALLDAIDAAGITKAAVADHLGVSPSMVSQWVSGHRPVSAAQAGPLARLVHISPAKISVDYRRVEPSAVAVSGNQAGRVAEATPSYPPGEIDQLRQSVDALTLAVAVMASGTIRHRPVEAAEMAAALRKRVPAWQREQGLLKELIELLERAKQT